jgi:photosystem II stability/assembly factor-like uncharacterized protein
MCCTAGHVATRFALLLMVALVMLVACQLPGTASPSIGPSPVAAPTTESPPSIPIEAGNPPGPVIALAVLPNNQLLAGVGPIGDPETSLTWQLYRGYGDSWQRLPWPEEAIPRSPCASPGGDTLFVVPLSNAIFGRGQAWGLLRSTDGGQTWRQALKGMDDPYVMDVALSPAFESDHTLFAVTWYSGVYFSSDGGNTWHRLSYRGQLEPSGGANPFDLAVAVSPDFRSTAGASKPTGQGMVIASFGHRLRLWNVNKGGWQTVPLTVTATLEDSEPPEAQLTAGVIAFSPDFVNDGSLYLYSGYAGLFRSDDRGETWQPAGWRLPTQSPPVSRFQLAAASMTEAYVLLQSRPETENPATPGTTGGGSFVLYRTRDGGMSWQMLKEPPVLGGVSAFALTRDGQGRVVLHLGGSQGGVSSRLSDELPWD